MTFPPGSLVRARGREWVVLPESKGDLLVLRPLGGTDEEQAGVYLPLETVEPARFDLPSPDLLGDWRSARLLREAVRLSNRAGAGPFRSFARIAVEPRAYQLVPLLLALRQDPIRLLIADDVGIGKTVEAALIARELLDRGEIRDLAVICPPHLAEQWQRELATKFHLEAERVLAGTAARLERGLRAGQSLFEVYPFTVVSMDFIKTERRRQEFARSCPRFVIVDEAHTCAWGQDGRGGRQQRHELLRMLAATDRHIVLVTATPHSGNPQAFRSLLTLLRPEFKDLPDDLTGRERAEDRRQVAQHLVQRQRGDIKRYLEESTVFPEREEREQSWELGSAYKKLFDRVWDYTQARLADSGGSRLRQRVQWWSVLGLLRALGSSPAAAAATLRNRASVADSTEEEVDAIGRRTVLDEEAEESVEIVDTVPGADPGDEDEPDRRDAAGSNDADHATGNPPPRRARDSRLLALAREADALRGANDSKLQEAAKLLKELLRDGYRPVVFCRFIETAQYVAEELRGRLAKDVVVEAVTGQLPPAEREQRVSTLAEADRRILVCTDCLSEGLDLQHSFDAVIHYDLSWNPTRHEQRAGRVDRYGQRRERVRVVTLYGRDNGIDGIVLEVLLRKHGSIRTSTGVSVPVPVSTTEVLEALYRGLVLRRGRADQLSLFGTAPDVKRLDEAWRQAADREKRSRTMFAQETIRVEEVAGELEAARSASGSAATVQAFTIDALRALKASVSSKDGRVEFGLGDLSEAVRDTLGFPGKTLRSRFELPVAKDETYLARTHPLVEGLATHVLTAALDPAMESPARRAGAIATREVATRTTLLLIRYRFDVVTVRGQVEEKTLAEELRLLAFEGAPAQAKWLDEAAAQAVSGYESTANVLPERARTFIGQVVEGYDALVPWIEEEARTRAAALLEAHQRVRAAARLTGVRWRVEPHLPADVVGIYVYLPDTARG